MKIAFNAIRVSNRAGSGFDTFIINFVNEFARYVYSQKLNIDFDIYTFYPQHFPEVKKENIKQVKILFWKIAGSAAKTPNHTDTLKHKIFNQLSGLKNFLADYLRIFWTQFVFPFLARKYDLTVALTEYDAALFINKQMVIVHNTVPFLFPDFPTKYRFYTYQLLPKILRKCKIITVSNILKEELVNMFSLDPQKISVVYEGVDQKIFHPAPESEIELFKKRYQIAGDYILAVGHSHPMKNFSGVVQAFSLIRKNHKINLVIAGYADKKLPLSDGMIFLGHVPNDKLYILYSGAKCFVFPTWHEGFGLPPLEAMACGCPVVVSNRGSLPEVCGEAAIYVDPDKPENIAQEVLKVLNVLNVLNDDVVFNQMIKKGFEQAKRFSWEKTVKDFLDIFGKFSENAYLEK